MLERGAGGLGRRPMERLGLEEAQTLLPGGGGPSPVICAGPSPLSDNNSASQQLLDPTPDTLTASSGAALLLEQPREWGAAGRYLVRKQRRHAGRATFQGQVYNFLERPVGWRCFIYHFTVSYNQFNNIYYDFAIYLARNFSSVLVTVYWGPKTVFFWAPALKWGLVVAGIGDLNRPAEKISILQALSLAITGLIWSRYSLVIIPKNYNLFAVNMFVAGTQMYQLKRALGSKKSR